ncbi:hypothetical protein [Phormidium sp. CCY1219]|nr:hypothetical protein [Phormidium sp. CCY1219]
MGQVGEEIPEKKAIADAEEDSVYILGKGDKSDRPVWIFRGDRG